MQTEEIWPPPPIRIAEEKSIKPDGRPSGKLLLSVFGTGILLSAMAGALCNAIDAVVCTDYFYALVFGQWVEFDQVWKASVIEGIREAVVLGVFVSGVFCVGASLICRSRLTYRLAFRCLLKILGGAFLVWGLGGLLAIGFASLRPAQFGDIFALPGGPYAWVFGSIWGIQIGSLASLVVVLVQLYIRRGAVAVSAIEVSG